MSKSPLNRFKAEFPAKSINEGYARMVAAAFVSQLDPTVADLADIKTAVAGFMNVMQENSFRVNGVFKASYNSLIDKVATENGTTSTFIYDNFATDGVIDWNEFLTSI